MCYKSVARPGEITVLAHHYKARSSHPANIGRGPILATGPRNFSYVCADIGPRANIGWTTGTSLSKTQISLVLNLLSFVAEVC